MIGIGVVVGLWYFNTGLEFVIVGGLVFLPWALLAPQPRQIVKTESESVTKLEDTKEIGRVRGKMEYEVIPLDFGVKAEGQIWHDPEGKFPDSIIIKAPGIYIQISDPDPKPALTGAPAQSLTQAQQVTVPTAERNLWKAAANVWQMRASQLYAETMVWQDLFWKRDFEKNKEQALYFSAKTDAAQQELENAHSLAVKTCAEAGQELDERLFSCKPKASETKPANTSQPPRDE